MLAGGWTFMFLQEERSMRRHRLPILATLLFSVTLTGCSTSGDETAGNGVDPAVEEQRLREIITAGGPLPSLDDAIFWSGAFPEPIVGAPEAGAALPQAQVSNRRNERSETEVRRLELSETADMAYEFSDFVLSFEMANTGQQTSFRGSLLRVWKQVSGEWQVAAVFMRPHETP